MLEYYQKPKITFSKQEIKDLLIATAALTIMFAFMDINIFSLIFNFSIYYFIGFLYILFECFLVSITGFLFHELGHKFTAQKFGCWAEFKINYCGLLLGIIMALSGFIVFFVPGAVYISGNINREKNGKIALAGPLTNLVISGAFGMFYFLIRFSIFYPTFIALCELFRYIAIIDTSLAVFNLIPVGILDGRKIYEWNKPLLITLIVLSIIFLVLIYIF
ncbi:MAG: site-2 protease family protein [Candidatus Helarchaeota archaeon]